MRLPPAAVAAAPLCLLVTLLPFRAPGVEDSKVAKPASQPTRGAEMIYGPVLSCSVEVPGKAAAVAPPPAPASGSKAPAPPKIPPSQVIAKGITVKLGEGDAGAITFDTDLMRMAVGWTGGFLDLKKTNIATYKGYDTGAGVVKGEVQFETLQIPGWSVDESFTDPRAEKIGPLPREVAHYKGMYLHGDRAVFTYSIAGVDVLESPEIRRVGEMPVLVRHFKVGPSKQPMHVLLDLPLKDGETIEPPLIHMAGGTSWSITHIRRGERTISIAKRTGTEAATGIEAGPAGVFLSIAPRDGTATIAVAVASGPELDVSAALSSNSVLADLCKGGPSRWPALPPMSGTVVENTAAYVVDTVPIPEENPWKSWMRLAAFDFLPDGRAVVATLSGDVWLVAGIDETLRSVSWRRIAVGLYEPLGLKVRDGEIFVHGKDQITRLRDLNGDEEIDFYECFNGDRTAIAGYHTFAFDLQTDREGNFYYVIGGNQLGTYRPGHACLVRVTADGTKSEIIATGFRAPNGLIVGPQDEVVVTDNQGQWIPSSKLNLVRPGGFYGHVADPRIDAKVPPPAGYDQPMCWIPMAMDNSSAGGVWRKDSGKWGPLGGHLLHVSFGAAALYSFLPQAISSDGVTLPGDGNHRAPAMQGAVAKLPVRFLSGTMRARFNPADGQLYVSGLKGWQTAAAKDGCLQRVRYTGGTLTVPTSLEVSGDTLKVGFASPLAPDAADPQSFSLEQWNYKWWETYGSPDFSAADPSQKKHDQLDVTQAELSTDRRTLTLKVPDLRFAMQTLLKGNLRFADGTESKLELAGTFYNAPHPTTAAAK